MPTRAVTTKFYKLILLSLFALVAPLAGGGWAAQAPFASGPVTYAEAGQGGASGVPVVLVHGWACSSEFFKEQLGPLAAAHRVLAIDLPGHGGSASSGPFTQESLAQAVLAVMDHAGLDRAVLVGHSMGAAVIRRVALLQPQRVAGLVLLDGAILFPPDDAAESARWKAEMEGFAAQFQGPEADAVTRSFVNSMQGQTTPQPLKDWILQKMLATPAPVRYASMAGFVSGSLEPLPAVQAPTLAVYAQSANTASNLETLLKGDFPNLEYHLLVGPGHFLMLEDPARVNDLLLRWLAANIR
ncbi:alpha/beta fold hydrolase [Megalodesulfovibrio paquesii]